MFTIYYSSRAKRNLKTIAKGAHVEKLRNLIDIISKDPFQTPPIYKKLVGVPYYARRLDRENRLVYSIDTELNLITIVSCWAHYQD